MWNRVALAALLVFAGAISVANAQSLAEKWDIGELTTGFNPETNTFTFTYAVDDSIATVNTAGQLYQIGCKEENLELNADEGITDVVTAVSSTGSATLTFTMNFGILSNYDTILNREESYMDTCVRFMLQTDNQLVEVNFLEATLRIFFDLTAGIVMDFNVAPLEKEVVAAEKNYGAEGFLCNAETFEPLEDNVFLPGSVLSVCVKPNEEALNDGLYMEKIEEFAWVRGAIRQEAIVGGGSSSNGLTIMTCGDPETGGFCSFTSYLVADFYRPPTFPPTPFPSSAGGGRGNGAPPCEHCLVCHESTPEITTEKLVHGFCIYKEANTTMNLNQRSSTTWYYNWGAYTNSIPNFSSETRLFEDSNYFPEIMYNGTETGIPLDEEFCEGGYFYRADHYEEEDVEQTLISIKKLGVYDSSEDVGLRFCTMVTADTTRDGGLNDHFMSTYYDPTPGLTFELGSNVHTFSGLIGWQNLAGYNYVASDALYERFGWGQDVHVIVDCLNGFCYSTYQGYFYLPTADKNGNPLTNGLVFRLTLEAGGNPRGVWVYAPSYRLTNTTNSAAYQKHYGVFAGETITLAYAVTGFGTGYWYRQGENAQFNATINQFSINGGDAPLDPNAMNVLCYDYTGDMCSYYPSYEEFWDNQLHNEGGGSRFLEEDADNADEPNGSFGEEDSNTRGLEGLDDADEYALVGGEGTILLDFSRRRNLDGAQGRSLQAAEEPVLRTFSVDATVAPGTDEIGSLRTAGGNRLQKSMGVLGFLAWATAVAVLVW